MRKSTFFERLRIHVPTGGSLKAMLPRSRNWLSSVVKGDPEVKDALNELSQLIRDYKDAAKPKYCREPASGFFSAEIDFFRPNSILFAVISAVSGVAGVVFGVAHPEFNAAPWADALLRTTVTVFVLGVSLVNLTRSISESGRFAGEYLNDSCRMKAFCCMTLLAALVALVARSLIAVTPVPLSVGLCGAAVGGAAYSLAMLAFVILETIRCSLPGKVIRVVSQYAARRLCYGYLKEAYLKFLTATRKEYLEEWCAEHCRAIHPPSKYYGHYYDADLESGEASKDSVVTLSLPYHGRSTSKDYDLIALRKLNDFLVENDATVYLEPLEYKSKQATFGVLSCENASQKDHVRLVVSREAEQIVRWRSFGFAEKVSESYERHLQALTVALCTAIRNGEPDEVAEYLRAAMEPLTTLRSVKGFERVIGTEGAIRRGYDLVRFHIVALEEIVRRSGDEGDYQSSRAFHLSRVLLNSVWEEARKSCAAMDWHTMELFTWLVPQMYKTIQDAGDKAKPLAGMRAQFGGFYTFADGWLDDNKTQNPEAANKMRLVLHEGLTKWLLMVLERPGENELVKQLCDAGRRIVFGRDGITFERAELVARHFVLAGHIMDRPEEAGLRAAAVERLFCEEHSHEADVNFDDLVDFYLSYPFPPDTLDEYLNLLTGSSSSSGGGSTGVHEMSLAFIYLAGFALGPGACEPKPITKDLSYEINGEAIKLVGDLFAHKGIAFGLEQLKAWRDQSKELQDRAEAKAIADAEFDDGKIEKWKTEFWEAYNGSD